ncbi:MAG: MBOAT family O-acyltransferase [Acetatifactor sp.]
MWLLAASYYFYMCWQPVYALLLLASTLITWLCSWWVYKARRPAVRKTALALCIFANLGILFYFKYYEFFLENINQLLSGLHINILEKKPDILLPVGISFYTFQALGYTVDVYRGKVKPELNPLRYATFVSFFPQLVAGPIERSESLLRQMREVDEKKVWNYKNITEGLTLMVWGMFVKMVIADRVAILVNTVFDSYYQYGTVALTAGAVGFAIQIYCDFMGYSTIAVGAAKVMGFTLMENFNTPYFAVSISDFWRRWHISLSSWFRDYVYIPLGGNRCSRIRKYFNLLVTFSASGLWHGANWTFVVWGLLHGIYQIVGDFTRGARQKLYEMLKVKKDSFSFKLGQMLITFILVDVAWIFFRADEIRDAVGYCTRLITMWDPWNFFNQHIYTLGLDVTEMHVLVAALAALLLADLVRYRKKQTVDVFLSEQCLWFRWIVIFALMAATLVYGIYGVDFDSTQFIYFQF